MDGAERLECRCCVVGGGPAGVMLGLLLARAGIDVVVLEKHADFFRDFRGDTVHPSTLEVLRELALLDAFLARPHQQARQLSAFVGGTKVTLADFSRLPTTCRFVAFMPQWDFLDLLAQAGRRYPGFRLLMNHEAVDLVEESGRVTGVRARAPEGAVEVRAGLVVGADGRRSTVRERAGLTVDDLGAPIDVLWFRLERRRGDPDQPLGRFDPGQIFILINRGGYFQSGLVIPKGGFPAIQAGGLEAFRARVNALSPLEGDRTAGIESFEDVKLLTVMVDRLRRWHRPGLLCIGDAAHAMSPVGGVGINLAIQDAVAAANILAEPLRGGGPVSDATLAAVQSRRELPTRLTQRLQLLVQDRIIRRTLGATAPLALPWPARLFRAVPALRRLPARLIGVGFRPEHVRTPDVLASRTAAGA